MKILGKCWIRKNIDAVTISTPDHTHAPAAVNAIKEVFMYMSKNH